MTPGFYESDLHRHSKDVSISEQGTDTDQLERTNGRTSHTGSIG
jgi:hypothetical protein